jgi:hypothetical protein
MSEYNWVRVIPRLALAFVLSVGTVIRAHISGFSCAGGFIDGLQFVVELLAAMLAVEGFHWMAWRMRQPSKALRLSQHSGVRISFPTGGKLFAPLGALSSFLLALLILRISIAYIGSVAPCEAADLSSISGKLIVAAIVEAYGLLLVAHAVLKMLPRS